MIYVLQVEVCMLARKAHFARNLLHTCQSSRSDPVRAPHLLWSTTTHAANMGKKAQPSGPRAMLWFRKGLRLHDNPALLDAIQAQNLFPVFCLDPWFLTLERVGVNRLKFLLESLEDLHASLQSRGSRLLVRLYSCAANIHCVNAIGMKPAAVGQIFAGKSPSSVVYCRF